MKKMLYRAALLATALVATVAAKSDRMAYEVMTINRYGHTGLWNTHSARTLGMGRLAFNVYGDFTSHSDFVKGVTRGDSTAVQDFNWGNTQFALGYGVTRFLDVSISMPLAFQWMGGNDFGTGDQFGKKVIVGAGDLEVGMTFQYPPYPHRKFFEMAYYGAVTIPTGNDANGYFPTHIYYTDKNQDSTMNRFYGSGKPEIDMKMLWTWDFREVADFFPVLFHVNYGLRWTVNYRTNHIFYLNAGLEVRPTDWLSIFGDFSAEPRFSSVQQDVIREGSDDKYTLLHDPMRIGPGVAFLTPVGFTVSAGAMFSLANEDGVVYGDQSYHQQAKSGSASDTYIETAVEPKAKFVASIGWNGFVLPQDYDNDGIKDNMDNCPREAEDFDGFNDGDGCPEVDNDNDGVADTLDKCMNEAEDKDGFEDEDGCPDLDNDEDGIPDLQDKCPMDAEDLDGFEDEDGCPDFDNDNDGIVDSLDACPDKAEDKDGFNDEDGCPDVDNDQDGIVDSLDKCPNEAETFNTFEDEDGCPDAKPVEQVVTAKPIERGNVVLRGVNFHSGKATLTTESYEILDEVVNSLREWPEIKIEVTGHTDSQGSERANKRLSYNRAKSVMNYFLQQGIEASRIRAIGMGEEMPIADNSTADGRALNRRVELKRID